MWHYKGEEFTSEMIGEYIGFVYIITDGSNDRKYIGKKIFKSKRKLPPLKGKTRKRTKIVESDWQKYYGSSEEVKLMVEEKGVDNFYREIIHLCEKRQMHQRKPYFYLVFYLIFHLITSNTL